MSSLERARESLGQRLRELREHSGLNGKQFAAALGWDPAQVSRFEHGKRVPSREQLRDWAETAGRPQVEAELLVMAASVEEMYATWRRQFRAGFAGRQRAGLTLDRRTRSFRAFESAIVPGLLQTPEYARLAYLRLVALYGLGSEAEVEGVVALRMDRQRILYQSGRTFHFVITEAALRHTFVPPDVMRGQLDRLISASTLQGVRLGLVPLDRQLLVAPFHGFWIFDDTLVQVEAISSELNVTDADEIAMYAVTFGALSQAALYGEVARTRIIALQRSYEH